jgi:hypothetical protein
MVKAQGRVDALAVEDRVGTEAQELLGRVTTVALALTLRPITAVAVVEAHPQRELTEHQPLRGMAETERHLALLAHPLPGQGVVVAAHTREEPLELGEQAVAGTAAQRERTIAETPALQTLAAEAVAGLFKQTQPIVLAAQAAQVLSSLNIPILSQSRTLAAVLPTQLQHRVALALQPLLPEPAMSLGVKHGTLRIS